MYLAQDLEVTPLRLCGLVAFATVVTVVVVPLLCLATLFPPACRVPKPEREARRAATSNAATGLDHHD